MHVSCTIASLGNPFTRSYEFDHWLHLASIGNRTILDLPVRKHQHFNKYDDDPAWTRCNSYIIHLDYVQFVFQKEMEMPDLKGLAIQLNKELLKGLPLNAVGVDTGIKKLAFTSKNEVYGPDLEKLIQRKISSIDSQNPRRKSQRAMTHYMDERAKALVDDAVKAGVNVLFIEDLKNLKKKTKQDQRLYKRMRKTLGSWNYAYWLQRLEERATANCVRVVRVSPAYTSQRCSVCGHVEKANRKLEDFECLSCGFKLDADHNAARNILLRGLSDLGVDLSISTGAVCFGEDPCHEGQNQDEQANQAPKGRDRRYRPGSSTLTDQ